MVRPPLLLTLLLWLTVACQSPWAVAQDPMPRTLPGVTPQTGAPTMPLPVFTPAADAAAWSDALWLDARAARDYAAGHIPGALSAPWQSFSVASDDGTVLPVAELEARLRALGVRSDQPIVIYGAWDAAWGEEGRLYWMLDWLGHPAITIVQGGVSAWTAAGGALTRHTAAPAVGDFGAALRPERRVTTDDLAASLDGSAAPIVLDTRTEEEFDGATWYGEARGGHIPGARHVPWETLVPLLDDPAAMQAWLTTLGIDGSRPVVAYCTGGIRSGFVYAALRAAGVTTVANYDASWWGWSDRTELPVSLEEGR
jgi:3-mercaptopyruvate sulfurtransferase SseA